MPVFKKPTFAYAWQPAAEIQRLRAHKAHRQIPAKAANRLLVATWNIANLGAQQRRDQDHQLLAEVLGWFDIVAIQECRENFGPLADIMHRMGAGYRLLMSDVAGNDERMAFVYDSARVTLLEKVGEIALPVADLKNVKMKGITRAFAGFDRSPYLAAFQAGSLTFTLVNVHLYFGSGKTKAAKQADMDRRTLETFAVARWAEQRKKSPYSYTRDVIALGDFNMPKRDPADPVFKALTAKGLHVPAHGSQVGSNLSSDADYDQIAFFAGETGQDFTGNHGVFDFDKVVFPDLFASKTLAQFRDYCRYYLSDHRPMWMQFRTA